MVFYGKCLCCELTSLIMNTAYQMRVRVEFNEAERTGVFMNRKKVIIIATVAVALCVLGAALFRHSQTPRGNTIESRVEILREALPNSTYLSIATEKKVEDYLICGIHSETQTGIAVFQQKGSENYKFVSAYCLGANEIVTTTCRIQDQWYNLIWFDGCATEYAEVIYTIDGIPNAPVTFDTSDGGVICSKAPSNHYSLDIKYYDADGNVFESPVSLSQQ